MMLLAFMATITAPVETGPLAAAAASETETFYETDRINFNLPPPQQRGETPPQNAIQNVDPPRRREQWLETTQISSDDEGGNVVDEHGERPSSFANGTKVFTPSGECELCPRNWRVAIERDDEKIKGEFESCVKYGRRRQFECMVLYQKSESSEKIARNVHEYRPCRYTESDEMLRMLRMQVICLLIGVWSMRNVLRQRVLSASLFDQRRMRMQNANGLDTLSNAKKYLRPQTRDSMETVELMPSNRGKVPKSPAPDPNFQTV